MLYLLVVHLWMKEENYIILFQCCSQQVWKVLLFLLVPLVFTVAVFQTPLSSLNGLEVSMESQHGQDGQYPALGCRLVWCRKCFGNCTEMMHLPEHNPKQNKVTERIFSSLGTFAVLLTLTSHFQSFMWHPRRGKTWISNTGNKQEFSFSSTKYVI